MSPRDLQHETTRSVSESSYRQSGSELPESTSLKSNLPDGPPLPPLLSEFRVALREEISAAEKTSSSSAIPLSNGRRIGTLAGKFQYSFAIESALNAPADAPGDLLIPGQ